jgi:zinc transporter ZupT
MIAASYWSLLAPAIELAAQDSAYGENGQFSFVPAMVGFLFGAFFVYLSDVIISSYEIDVLNLLIPGNCILLKVILLFILF